MVPVLVVLVVGAADMWRRKASFQWGSYGGWVGALAGAVALGVAWTVTGGWAEDRDPLALFAMAAATELALRGWLVERIYRGRGEPSSDTRAVLAVLAGAIAEAALTPGDLTARIGAGAFGAGLGWMYVGGGLLAPLAARLVFALGAIVLQFPW
jgi:hypothetical protein